MEPTDHSAEKLPSSSDEPESRQRREALVTLGRYSAFTAPTVATLLVVGREEAFGGSGVGGVRPGKPKPPKPPKQKKPR